jgi:hypothetical protein
MISCDRGRCSVQGPLTMANVTGVLAESASVFQGNDVLVDLCCWNGDGKHSQQTGGSSTSICLRT